MGALQTHKLYDAIEILLQIEAGPDKGKGYRIRPPKIIIGRDPAQSQIALTDPKVSRKQCQILFGDEVTCQDLSSRKNTLVNGKPCLNQALKPGDIISFGDTSIKFLTRSKKSTQNSLPGAKADTPAAPGKKSNLQKFLVVIVALVAVFLFIEENPEPASETELLTQEAVNKQIEESKERSRQINENRAERRKLAESKYLYDVEKHFISGFRDFQNAQYGRAIDSFGTTIATDQTHARAQRYSKTAKKKRDNLIETHLRDGQRYREKMMYNRCAAELEKAIVLMNNTNSKQYELAKTQLEECRLLKLGGLE